MCLICQEQGKGWGEWDLSEGNNVMSGQEEEEHSSVIEEEKRRWRRWRNVVVYIYIYIYSPEEEGSLANAESASDTVAYEGGLGKQYI